MPSPLLVKLELGLSGLGQILRRATAEQLRRRGPGGRWSAHENLAHLGRYQEVFMGRVGRILGEDRPAIPRYRAEDDGEFPGWVARATDQVVADMSELRRRMLGRLAELPDGDWRREGVHPLYGRMTLEEWAEFFVIHEGHHLYTAVLRLGEAGVKADG